MVLNLVNVYYKYKYKYKYHKSIKIINIKVIVKMGHKKEKYI